MWCGDGAGMRVSQSQHGLAALADVSSGAVFLGRIFLLLLCAADRLFTSRGEFHTDTNIYHAAAIRIYEEYGLVKGIGNLQLHYAYNSSCLAFASIFSMKWLLGSSCTPRRVFWKR